MSSRGTDNSFLTYYVDVVVVDDDDDVAVESGRIWILFTFNIYIIMFGYQ